MRFTPLPIALVVALLPLAGCNREKLGELADKAKQAVTESAEQVKEKAGVVTDATKEQMALAGSCEVMLDAPIASSACYVTFLQQASGRPNVLQVRSYRNANQESFPSLMLQSQVNANGISELVGQTIPGQLFVQPAQDAPVWFCPPGGHVDLKIVAVDDKQLNAEIIGGSLRNSRTGGDQPVSGKLTGVLSEPSSERVSP
jgi:hypothetical protein